jgi:hypothetical protein
MSNFLNPDAVIVQNQIEFGQVTTSSIQKFTCKDGETAGFQIVQVGTNDDGTPYYVSQVFNCSSGDNVLLYGAAVMPGKDLCGGAFSSGCYPDADPLASGTIFYKVDY